jgi:hypothetical protein
LELEALKRDIIEGKKRRKLEHAEEAANAGETSADANLANPVASVESTLKPA